MLLTGIIQYLRGYLIIKVTGRYPERFLNVCANRHILIWDVFPCSQTVLRCRISNRGFKMLHGITRKTGVQVKIIKKCGLVEVIKRGKKRKWFVAGLLGFCLLMVGLNQFIWKIEIVGCETLSVMEVREELKSCGLKIGAFRPFLDEKKLQTKMLLRKPEIAWLWADKSGSKVVVQVKERVPKPELFDEDALCNVVAARDGVIESMIVRSGVPLVQLGDSVRKGDILVSGLILSEKGVEPRKVQSDAEIYGRVWYERTKAFSLWQTQRHKTGQKERKITLHLFGLNLNLFLNEASSFQDFEEDVTEHEMKAFGCFLGVGATVKTYHEVTVTYEKITPESTAKSGGLLIESELDEEASPNATKKGSQMTYQVLDEDTVEVNVVIEYLEDIAEKVHIE